MKTRITCLLMLLLVLASCATAAQPDAAQVGWQPADLRMIFPDGETAPEWDLVAASARATSDGITLRLDVLDLQPETRLHAYLAMDDRPGGSRELPIDGNSDIEWDFLLSAPDDGLAQVITPDGRSVTARQPWMQIDRGRDALVFHLAGLELQNDSPRFQAFLTQPGSSNVQDSTPVFSIDVPPPAPARLLLAFWNSLPAGSPVQLMRRWNGAHTGPEGHRHGLRQLLDAARDASLPIALLDLKRPDSLAGLDLVGGLETVQQMQDDGLLILPEVAYGDPLAAVASLERSRRVAANYGLEQSPLAYGALNPEQLGGFRAVFATADDVVEVGGVKRVPLPVAVNTQPADVQGPSLEVRRALLAAAREGGGLTVLGGSLPETVWADALYAGPAFDYFAQHPWIEPLDGDALLDLPASTTASAFLPPGCADMLCSPALPAADDALRAGLRADIAGLKDEVNRDLLWDMYLHLTQPATDLSRAQLQSVMLPHAAHLLEAARWAENPSQRSECLPDRDGQVCYLASETVFAALHSRGGRLALLAGREGASLRQWIGPSYQFALGLGDPAEWKLDQGAFADPRAYPGAFLDGPTPPEAYSVAVNTNEVTFTTSDGGQKRYYLGDSTLTVQYSGIRAASTQVALTALPHLRQQPGWADRYRLERAGQSTLCWSGDGEGSITLSSNGPVFTAISFLDAGPLISQSEDPDHDYPRGHTLPIPLLVVEFSTAETFQISLKIE